MAERIYATHSDYADFHGTAAGEESDEVNAKLRRASRIVEGLTRLARYDVDEDGMPTDADVAAAFTEATCAQLAWWEDTDDMTGAASTAGAVKIGSVSLGTTSSAGSSQTPASSRVSPETVDILTTAGLITGAVNHR